MSVVPEHFKLTLQPRAARDAMVQADNVRFTLLTERLIRLEFHPENCFEDRASQAFWFREQPVPEFTSRITPQAVEIETAFLHLSYQRTGEGFTPANLTIALKENEKFSRSMRRASAVRRNGVAYVPRAASPGD